MTIQQTSFTVSDLRALLSRASGVCQVGGVYTKGGARVPRGTGVLIGNALIMTAAHVLPADADCRSARAVFVDEKGKFKVPLNNAGGFFFTSSQPKSTTNSSRKWLDYTIVSLVPSRRLANISRSAFNLLRSSVPSGGAKGTIIYHQRSDHGENDEEVRFDGSLRIKKAVGSIIHYVSQNLVEPMTSGSPVMDSRGNLIALHIGKCGEEKNCGFGVSIGAICKHLKEVKRFIDVTSYKPLSITTTLTKLYKNSFKQENFEELLILAKKRPTTEGVTQKTSTGDNVISVDTFSSQLLEKQDKSQKKVILLGYAGAGKSMLCQKIAYDWAINGEKKGGFKALYFLKLKNLTAMEEDFESKDWLYDAIAKYCLGDIKLSEDVKKQIESETEKTLLVLDGFDEASTSVKNALSFTIKSAGLHILLTSRLWESLPIQGQFKEVFEVRGFADKVVEKYAKKFSGKNNLFSEFYSLAHKRIKRTPSYIKRLRLTQRKGSLVTWSGDPNSSDDLDNYYRTYDVLQRTIVGNKLYSLQLALYDLCMKYLISGRRLFSKGEIESALKRSKVSIDLLTKHKLIGVIDKRYCFQNPLLPACLVAQHVCGLSMVEQKKFVEKYRFVSSLRFAMNSISRMAGEDFFDWICSKQGLNGNDQIDLLFGYIVSYGRDISDRNQLLWKAIRDVTESSKAPELHSIVRWILGEISVAPSGVKSLLLVGLKGVAQRCVAIKEGIISQNDWKNLYNVTKSVSSEIPELVNLAAVAKVEMIDYALKFHSSAFTIGEALKELKNTPTDSRGVTCSTFKVLGTVLERSDNKKSVSEVFERVESILKSNYSSNIDGSALGVLLFRLAKHAVQSKTDKAFSEKILDSLNDCTGKGTVQLDKALAKADIPFLLKLLKFGQSHLRSLITSYLNDEGLSFYFSEKEKKIYLNIFDFFDKNSIEVSKQEARALGYVSPKSEGAQMENQFAVGRISNGQTNGTGFLVGQGLLMVPGFLIRSQEDCKNSKVAFCLPDSKKIILDLDPKRYFYSSSISQKNSKDTKGWFTIVALRGNRGLDNINRYAFNVFDLNSYVGENNLYLLRHLGNSGSDSSRVEKAVSVKVGQKSRIQYRLGTSSDKELLGAPIVDSVGRLVGFHLEKSRQNDGTYFGVGVADIVRNLEKNNQTHIIKAFWKKEGPTPSTWLHEKLTQIYIERYKNILGSLQSTPPVRTEEAYINLVDTLSVKGKPNKISIDSLFAPSEGGKSGHRKVLLTGSQGSGKSTICRSIAYNWARGRFLSTKFDAIFFLPLLQMEDDFSDLSFPLRGLDWLGAVIAKYLFRNENLRQSIIDQISRGKDKVLFILDGDDEVSSSLKNKLVSVLSDNRYHMIMTSAESGIEEEGISFERIVRTYGFDDYQKTTYIRRFFSKGKKDPSKFIDLLSKNPRLWSLVSVPLNLEIFCHAWATGCDPEYSLTNAVGHALKWAVDVSREKGSRKYSKESLGVLYDLLGRIAFKGIQEGTSSVSRDVCESYLEGSISFVNLEESGLFRASTEKGGGLRFLNPIFQDYLAARLVSRLPEVEQKKIVEKYQAHPRCQKMLSMVAKFIGTPFFDWLFHEKLHNDPNPNLIGGVKNFARFQLCIKTLSELQSTIVENKVWKNYLNAEATSFLKKESIHQSLSELLPFSLTFRELALNLAQKHPEYLLERSPFWTSISGYINFDTFFSEKVLGKFDKYVFLGKMVTNIMTYSQKIKKTNLDVLRNMIRVTGSLKLSSAPKIGLSSVDSLQPSLVQIILDWIDKSTIDKINGPAIESLARTLGLISKSNNTHHRRSLDLIVKLLSRDLKSSIKSTRFFVDGLREIGFFPLPPSRYFHLCREVSANKEAAKLLAEEVTSKAGIKFSSEGIDQVVKLTGAYLAKEQAFLKGIDECRNRVTRDLDDGIDLQVYPAKSGWYGDAKRKTFYVEPKEALNMIIELAKSKPSLFMDKSKMKTDKMRFHSLICKRDLEGVKRVIDSGRGYFRRMNRQGCTALHFAALYGRLEVVQYLIENDLIEIEAVNEHGATALHFAAYVGELSVAKYLIDKVKVDPDEPDANGRTPLHYAVLGSQSTGANKLGMVDWLVNKKLADPNAADNGGVTPLHFACFNGNCKVIRTLMDATKVHKKEDTKGRSPLHWAVEGGEVKAVKLVVSATNSTAIKEDGNGSTPLHIAAKHRDKELIDYLLTLSQVKPDLRDEVGATPLHWIAARGDLSLIKLFIDRWKVPPTVIDKSQATLLHWSALRGHTKVLSWLVGKCGLNLNVQDRSLGTPLHWAASAGRLETVKWMVSKGNVDPWLKDIYGSTAADLAVKREWLEVGKWLNGLSSEKIKDMDGV